MSTMHFPTRWQSRLCDLIAAPNDHERYRFFTAWATAEGGDAQWNPLNTTLPLNATWDMPDDYNSAHVKNYRWALAGICATALTLAQRNPDGSYVYPLLWLHLRDQDATAEQIVTLCRADIKKWGTNPDTIAAVLKTLA